MGTVGDNELTLLYEGAPPDYTISNSYIGTELNWRVDSNAVPGGVDAVSNVILRVRDTGGYEGYSQPFKIVSTPRIEIISPQPGVYWKVGDTEQIKWIRGGQMEAADFRVFFSKDDFATVDEIYGTITFNTSNNTYSMDWPILDRLGTKRVLVTNVVNEVLVDRSQEFDIVGNFDVNFPNGDVGEEVLYSKNTYTMSWLTKGTVGFVDLYYKAGSNDWVKFASDVLDNGDGVIAQRSGSSWTTPLPSNQTVWVRVQDSSYTNLFDGVTPGPYDDSDNPFPLKWYDVWWLVGYTNSPFHPLDGLSMRDNTLGVSRSGLSCKDANGDPQYIGMKYPYGVFTTEWFREFYARYVDFDWLCNSNMVRIVYMDESEIEPDPAVMADFSYSYASRTFAIQSWLEQGGHILETPDEARVYIYDQGGTEIAVVTGLTHNAGVFWMNWNASAYGSGETFFARTEIDLSGSTYSSGRTIQMREAASAEIETVLDAVDGAVSSIVSEVTGVGSAVSNLGVTVGAGFSNLNDRVDSASNVLGRIDSGVSGGFSNLNDRVDSVSNMLVNIGTSMDDMSNVVIRSLSEATNVLLEIRGPISNIFDISRTIWDGVSNVNQRLMDTDFASILTRPESVPYGSTNTFLYKTMRNFDPSVVELTVSDPYGTPVHGPVNMGEVSPGLGIYSNRLVADWGVGDFTILCTDPMYQDSMVLYVGFVSADEALPAMMAAISNDIALLDVELGLVKDTVDDVQLTVDGVETTVGDVQTRVVNVEINTDEVEGKVDDVDGKVDDVQLTVDGVETTVGDVQTRVVNVEINTDEVEGKVDDVDGKVDDVQKAVDDLGDMGNVESSLADVKKAVEDVQDKVADLQTSGLEIDLSAIERLESRIGSLEDSVNQDTLLGQIKAILAKLDGLEGIAGDAASKAQQAKSEISSLASTLQSLKEQLAAGDQEGVQQSLAKIETALGNLRERLLQIPKSMNLDSLYEEIARLTSVVNAMAESQGMKILAQMTAFPAGAPGVPVAEGTQELLGAEGLAGAVQILEELKALAAFIQATMEAQSEIVVTDGLIPIPDAAL